MPLLPDIIPSILPRLVLALMLLMSTSGCRTPSPVLSERLQHDTLYQALLRYDSIFIMDHSAERYHPSAYHYDSLVNSYLRVDTLYKDKVKTEYRYRLLHDTTYIHRTDTITKTITLQQPPAKPIRAPVWCSILIFTWLLLLLFLLREKRLQIKNSLLS